MNTNDKIQIQIETDEAVLGFKKDSEWAIKQILSSSPIIEATQPTSSASSAENALTAAKAALLDANRNGFTRGNDALLLINDAIAAIVPPVVQAPMDTELLASLKNALMNAEYAINGREHTGFITKAIKSIDDYVAAPKVATVPSEQVAWWNGLRKFDYQDGTQPAFSPVETTDHDIPLHSWPNPCSSAPISTATEQASDVRNAALEEAIEKATYEPLAEPYDDFMHGYIRGRKDSVIRISKLKSATPADKGNAPVETKS